MSGEDERVHIKLSAIYNKFIICRANKCKAACKKENPDFVDGVCIRRKPFKLVVKCWCSTIMWGKDSSVPDI